MKNTYKKCPLLPMGVLRKMRHKVKKKKKKKIYIYIYMCVCVCVCDMGVISCIYFLTHKSNYCVFPQIAKGKINKTVLAYDDSYFVAYMNYIAEC